MSREHVSKILRRRCIEKKHKLLYGFRTMFSVDIPDKILNFLRAVVYEQGEIQVRLSENIAQRSSLTTLIFIFGRWDCSLACFRQLVHISACSLVERSTCRQKQPVLIVISGCPDCVVNIRAFVDDRPCRPFLLTMIFL